MRQLQDAVREKGEQRGDRAQEAVEQVRETAKEATQRTTDDSREAAERVRDYARNCRMDRAVGSRLRARKGSLTFNATRHLDVGDRPVADQHVSNGPKGSAMSGSSNNSVEVPGSEARTPTDIPSSGWRQVLDRVVDTMREDHVSLLAAGLAFKALLALFPAFIAAISIWGLVADPDAITEQLEEMTDALPDEAAALIEQQLTDIAAASTGALSGALLVSIILALWSASGGMMGMIQACNAAYNEVDERSFFHRRGLALVFTVGALLFLFVALALIVFLPPLLGQLGLGTAAALAIRILQWPVLALLVLVVLALIYRFAPDRRAATLRWTTGGAILATVLWLIGSVLFAFYVEVAGDFAATYGALAGVVVLMLWLYLTSFVILLGAEFNAETERQTGVDTTIGPSRPLGERDAVVADSRPDRGDEGTSN